MLCVLCQNVMKAPKIVAAEKAPEDNRVYYNHHASVLELENSAKQKCHLCVLIRKCFCDEYGCESFLMISGRLQYWFEELDVRHGRFRLRFCLGSQYFGSLKILSPSRITRPTRTVIEH